jgi:hypothetical protein
MNLAAAAAAQDDSELRSPRDFDCKSRRAII